MKLPPSPVYDGFPRQAGQDLDNSGPWGNGLKQIAHRTNIITRAVRRYLKEERAVSIKALKLMDPSSPVSFAAMGTEFDIILEMLKGNSSNGKMQKIVHNYLDERKNREDGIKTAASNLTDWGSRHQDQDQCDRDGGQQYSSRKLQPGCVS